MWLVLRFSSGKKQNSLFVLRFIFGLGNNFTCFKIQKAQNTTFSFLSPNHPESSWRWPMLPDSWVFDEFRSTENELCQTGLQRRLQLPELGWGHGWGECEERAMEKEMWSSGGISINLGVKRPGVQSWLCLSWLNDLKNIPLSDP